MPAQAFIARMVEAARGNEISRFRNSIAAVDALLLDDLPLSASFNATRQAIYAEIDKLSIRNVPIVVTCSSRPVDLPHQLAEIASVIDMGYPDLTARTEIARREIERRDFTLPDAAVRSLAAHASGSPRKIQSAIARMVAEARLSN